VDFVVEKLLTDYLTDELDIETDYKHHAIPILLNEELVATYLSELNLNNQLILQTYPNPFDNSIFIQIELDQESSLSIEIFDMSKRSIKVLETSDNYQKDSHVFSWDGTNLAGIRVENGVYVCCVKVNDKIFVKKIIKQ